MNLAPYWDYICEKGIKLRPYSELLWTVRLGMGRGHYHRPDPGGVGSWHEEQFGCGEFWGTRTGNGGGGGNGLPEPNL